MTALDLDDQLAQRGRSGGGSGFDIAIEVLLGALLVFMPAAFGVVHGWSELIVIIAVGAMAVVLAFKMLMKPGDRVVGTWTYVPIVVFLLIALLQLSWFPVEILRVISPNTVDLKAKLLGKQEFVTG